MQKIFRFGVALQPASKRSLHREGVAWMIVGWNSSMSCFSKETSAAASSLARMIRAPTESGRNDLCHRNVEIQSCQGQNRVGCCNSGSLREGMEQVDDRAMRHLDPLWLARRPRCVKDIR